MSSEKQLLLFDGVCNLCNRSVQTVIRFDKKDKFLFAALQSKTGKEKLGQFKLSTQHFDTFILIQQNNIYFKSSAALKVLKELGGLWSLLYIFIVIPKPIRDGIYTLIAKNRYRFFGKKDSCMVPTPETTKRFLP